MPLHQNLVGFGTRVGGDQFYPSVVALLHCDGADASTTFDDETGRVWTAGGNAQIDTAQSYFGGASALFDGSGDYISAANPTLYSADFTIQGFVRFNAISANRVIFATYNMAGSQGNTLIISLTSGNRLNISNGLASVTGTTAITTGVWYYVMFTYTHTGTAMRLYLNNALEISQTGAISNGAANMYFGGSPGDNNIGTWWMNGWLDEWRITKGIARSDISIPIVPFANYGR